MNFKDKGLFVLLFVTVFFFVSCASYETRPITSDIMYDISSKTVSDENVTVEKSFWSMITSLGKEDTRSIASSLQYFVSDTVMYDWLEDETAENRSYTITKDGRLMTTDKYRDRVFVILEDTEGVLSREPEMRNGKMVLTVDFADIEVEFTESNDGLFYLSTPIINVDGYSYKTENTCTLLYKSAVEKEELIYREGATGKKIKN